MSRLSHLSLLQRLDGVASLWPLYSRPRIAYTLGLTLQDVDDEIDAIIRRDAYIGRAS